MPQVDEEGIGAALAAAGVAYNEMSEQLRERAKTEQVDFQARGPPQVHTFVRLVQRCVARSAPGGACPAPGHYQVMKAYYDEVIMIKLPPQLMEEVHQCRYRKAGKGKGKKSKGDDDEMQADQSSGILQLCVNLRSKRAVAMLEHMEAFLLADGCTRLMGSAPRGPLEREGSRLLQAIERSRK